ncbi:MAG: type II secretion system protein [Campylobacter sp.]|nr:type II secretion system protein [Campylobacter sp.]
MNYKDGVLVALGYNSNEGTVAQLKAILSKCDFEDNELKRIVELNDNIKKYEGAYIAMSNSNPYFKVKIETADENLVKVFREDIFAWSDKYKLKLEKVDGKETYYITGRA